MAKYKALGTQLSISDGAPTTPAFAVVAQLRTIEGPGGDAEEIDVTSHDSPATYRETLPSFKDPGEITMEGVYDPALASHDGTTGLASLYSSGEVRAMKVILPTTPAAELTFDGWVKSFRTSEVFDGALTFNATVRVTGPITFP